MANVRASARSTTAIHSYLSDRSRACDAHIDALHQTIQQSRKPKVTGVPINNTYKPSTRVPPTKSSYSHSSSNSLKRSILKKTPPQEAYDKAESVEQWFQRVLRTKQLSPLDLCDLFSYGDARRHATVPLRHVCDVLFDLDPDGCDPVSPDMEAFLSGFAFEDARKGGDVVVNVKDALRALNIWQSGITSSKTSKAASSSMKPSASRSPERPQRITQSPSLSPQQRVLLEAKNKKLLGVIASLEDANLQLSQQLKDATTGKEALHPPSKVHSMATTSTPLSCSMLSSSWLSASSSSAGSSSVDGASTTAGRSSSSSDVVNAHEHELIRIATHLQYDGVKQLEELLLPESDTNTTGFVSLRQLRWLLAEKFHVENVTETLLMEMCLGMNFNAQSQVDAREFVHVLLDILIYASTPPRRRRDASSRDLLRTAIQQYLSSDGFDASADSRMMLTALCAKYDLERDARISVSEIMRVLYHDLPAQHTTHAPFPLAQNDALCVLEPFVKEQPSSSSDRRQRGFLSYLDLVEWILASPTDEPKDMEVVVTARALDWGFWAKLRTILCSGNATNRALESKIHAQLCKIFKKLDPRRTFCVSQRHFLRVVDNHIDANDLAIVTSVLTDTDGGNSKASEYDTVLRLLRYDVFMKLVFGAPALQTDPNRNKLFQRIVHKLRHADKAHEGKDGVDENATKVSTLRTALVAWLQKYGGAWRVTLPALHQLLCGATDHAHASSSAQLTMVELLFLFAHLDADHDGFIPLHSLWTFLKRECWRTASDGMHRHDLSKRGDHQKRPRLEDTRRALTRCLRAYNLERALSSKYKRDSISQDQLLREIYDMLHVLGYDDDDDDVGSDQSDNPLDPAHLQQFLASIVVTANDADPELFRMGRLNLTIPIDALFDALFDWDAVLHVMQLPHKLVDVKNTFERFDWHKNGSIALADWNKAWRQISASSSNSSNGSGMAEWELHVLHRQFPGHATTTKEDADSLPAIDYAHFLVHLMDRQHHHARRLLKKRVIAHFRAKCTSYSLSSRVSSSMRTFETIDALYHQINVDGKECFTMRDLQQYLIRALVVDHSTGDIADSENDELLLAIHNVNVMAHVFEFLAGSSHTGDEVADERGRQHHSRRRAREPDHQRAIQVTRDRFHERIAKLLSLATYPEDANLDATSASRLSRSMSIKQRPHAVTTVCDLELAILDICSIVSTATAAHGRNVILPTRAFRHLSGHSHRSSRSPSPTRSRNSSSRSPSRSQSPNRASLSNSITTRSPYREIAAMPLDPLTPARLQNVLLKQHNVQVSRHLVSQFFVHIGSHSKSFLELLPFAKWIAPLSVDEVAKVRQIVSAMRTKAKGGGGSFDLDRFLKQLHRRLLDSPRNSFDTARDDDDEEENDLRFVRPSLLHAKLQELQIPISRADLATLLRHVGMDEHERIDYALFLQRIYELHTAAWTTTLEE